MNKQDSSTLDDVLEIAGYLLLIAAVALIAAAGAGVLLTIVKLSWSFVLG